MNDKISKRGPRKRAHKLEAELVTPGPTKKGRKRPPRAQKETVPVVIVTPEPKPRKPRQTKPRSATIVNANLEDHGPGLGRKPSTEQIEQRQDFAYKLRLQGRTPEEIGAYFGVTDRQARNYIADAKSRILAELRALDGKAGVVRQFTILNYVLEESIEAWEKSKTASIVVNTGQVKFVKENQDSETPVPSIVKKSENHREENNFGNPVYLDRILKASAELRNLLGLDAPTIKRILVAADPVTDNSNYETLQNLSTDELLARYRSTIGLGGGLGK